MLQKSLVFILLCAMCWSLAEAQSDESKDRMNDKDAKIIYKPKGKPNLTKVMESSGYCCLIFDITKNGKPININTIYCTDEQLSPHFIKRVEAFRFSPAMSGGQPVYRRNKIYTPGYLKYRGKRGAVIPGPNGFMEPKNPDETIPSRPKKEAAKMKWVRKYFSNKKVCKAAIS